jgi:hypothetical protein
MGFWMLKTEVRLSLYGLKPFPEPLMVRLWPFGFRPEFDGVKNQGEI